jgi:hypothetical protein
MLFFFMLYKYKMFRIAVRQYTKDCKNCIEYAKLQSKYERLKKAGFVSCIVAVIYIYNFRTPRYCNNNETRHFNATVKLE